MSSSSAGAAVRATGWSRVAFAIVAPALVGRRQLDVPVADQRVGDLDRAGVRRELVLAAVRHLDLDVATLGLDAGHLADLYAEDAHRGARVDADGGGELAVTFLSPPRKMNSAPTTTIARTSTITSAG